MKKLIIGLRRQSLIALSLGLLLGGCAALPTQQEQADAMMKDMKAQGDAIEHAFDKCIVPGLGTYDLACSERVKAGLDEQRADNERWQAEVAANRQRQQQAWQAADIERLQQQVSDLRSAQAESQRNLHGLEDEYGLTP